MKVEKEHRKDYSSDSKGSSRAVMSVHVIQCFESDGTRKMVHSSKDFTEGQ